MKSETSGKCGDEPDNHAEKSLLRRAFFIALSDRTRKIVILQGSRPRGPRTNVRLLTIADSFPAKAELEELLRACAVAWPYYANITRSELERISSKTRTHLRKRGLI